MTWESKMILIGNVVVLLLLSFVIIRDMYSTESYTTLVFVGLLGMVLMKLSYDAGSRITKSRYEERIKESERAVKDIQKYRKDKKNVTEDRE